MSKRLIARSKLSNRQLNQLVYFFALEVPAMKAAHVLRIHRHSAERVYQVIRQHLAWECERQSPLRGEVEADESYFGGHRKGLRGRGAAGKVAVFGLLKRRGQVYTRPVPNVTRETLRAVIRQKVPKGSTIYSDQFASYDGLITEGYRHYRINHGESFATSRRQHINGIENFWGYAKTKLKRYYGIPRNQFFLYLKEMEFRFNHRHDDLPLLIRRILKKAKPVLD
jgi:transposase-like protein